ncbi:hypothetical protein P4050_30575 [Pseudomonas aeruginosa]|nr:hypothetical protein [Pseudomonas aeruginosa]
MSAPIADSEHRPAAVAARAVLCESVKELVTAPDLGFFFENAVAA